MKGWTLNQIVVALEQAFVVALGAFVGALTVTGSSVTGLKAGGIAAGVSAAYSLSKSLGLGTATQPVTVAAVKATAPPPAHPGLGAGTAVPSQPTQVLLTPPV
jgi:hypothetical protein